MKAINTGRWICFVPSILMACIGLLLSSVSFNEGWYTVLIMLVTAGLGIAAFIDRKNFILTLLSLIAGCGTFIWFVYQARELYLDITTGAVSNVIGIVFVVLLLAIPFLIMAGSAVHLFGIWKEKKSS